MLRAGRSRASSEGRPPTACAVVRTGSCAAVASAAAGRRMCSQLCHAWPEGCCVWQLLGMLTEGQGRNWNPCLSGAAARPRWLWACPPVCLLEVGPGSPGNRREAWPDGRSSGAVSPGAAGAEAAAAAAAAAAPSLAVNCAAMLKCACKRGQGGHESSRMQQVSDPDKRNRGPEQ